MLLIIMVSGNAGLYKGCPARGWPGWSWAGWRVLVGVALALVVGISINYLFLPIRAGQFPAINEGEPIGFFSTALSEVLGRAQYAKPSVFERQADLMRRKEDWRP